MNKYYSSISSSDHEGVALRLFTVAAKRGDSDDLDVVLLQTNRRERQNKKL